MKVKGDAKAIVVTQTALSRAFGLTSGRVSQLVKEGVVVRDEADKSGGVFLFESTKRYYSRSGGAGQGDGEAVDFNIERAKHEAASRKMAELKLAKMRQDAYDARTVEMVMTEMLSNLRTQLLGLPSKLAPQLDGKSKDEIYRLMTREIEEKLVELSEYTPELFTQEEIEDEKSD